MTSRSTVSSVRPMRVTLILVGLLLFLRIPFLAGLTTLLPSADWVARVFEPATYAVTAALICWERERLLVFHMDGGAIVLFLLAPFLENGYELLLVLLRLMPALRQPIRWIEMLIAFALALALLLTRTRIPKGAKGALRWTALGITVGLVYGIAVGQLYARLYVTLPGPHLAAFWTVALSFLLEFVGQMARAATYEEPFFRGFLWGTLRRLGWKDLWIWLLQAALFGLGHIYYIVRYPITFAMTFVAGLVLGLLVWGSRRVSTSMVAHALANCGSFLTNVLNRLLSGS